MNNITTNIVTDKPSQPNVINDLIEGIGSEKQRGGFEYSGNFHQGKKHGIGKIVSKNGTTYSGSWYKGKKDGFGVESLPNGTKYIGEWRKGYKNGRGGAKKSNGDFLYGIWIDGKFEIASNQDEISLFLRNKYSEFIRFDFNL